MRFGVVVFPGSNCDYDCFHALRDVLKQDVVFLWHGNSDLQGCDCVVLPGGFSYGDYLRAGAIARFSPIMEAIRDFVSQGGIVVGICNGFQILLESGLLRGALLPNRNGRFICRYVHLRVENVNTPFTYLCAPGEVLRVPIAHYQGNFFLPQEELKRLEERGQVLFRYCGPSGEVDERYNPNGSVGNVAGIASSDFRVMGMMPHPERACEELLGSTDGRKIFLSIAAWLEEKQNAGYRP